MALENYATLEELKQFLRIPGAYPGTMNAQEDVTDDIPLELAISAASRSIDTATNRYFGQAISTKYFTPVYRSDYVGYVVPIDDLMTTSGLVISSDSVGDFTWSETVASGYLMTPFGGGVDKTPWTGILLDRDVSYPKHFNSIKITANWGWDQVPDTIKEATLIQASRLFKRRDAPFGVAGSPELGNELRLLPKLDPDVYLMVNDYKRWWSAA